MANLGFSTGADPFSPLQASNKSQIWLPIGFRGRGAPSGNAYDSTNTYLMDQQVFQAPAWASVSAVKIVYAQFDMDTYGEVQRAASATIKASLVNRAAPAFYVTCNAACLTGSATLSFTEPNGVNIRAGMYINTGGHTSSNVYVASAVPTYNGSGAVTAFTVTMSSNAVSDIASGTSIGFSNPVFPATFGGSTTGNLQPGMGYVLSDPVNVNLNAGQTFYVRTYSTLGSTGVILQGIGTNDVQVSGDACQRTTTANDLSQAWTNPTHTGSGYWGPIGIIGLVSSYKPALLIIGDSISVGNGDTSGTAAGQVGFIQRSLTNQLPWFSVGRIGASATWHGRQFMGAFAALQLANFTDVLIEYCRNDLAASISAATTKTNLKNMATPFLNAGKRVWVCTACPTSTSTDSWVTTVNQTVTGGGYETARLTYNSDIRANWASYGYSGLIDIASIVEDQANPGKWNVTGGAWTGDGVHPNGLGVTNVVNAGIITPTMFTPTF